MQLVEKIGLGGGCHWCTEAVFESLKRVEKVEQGYIASSGTDASFSEGVLVYFHPEILSLKKIIEIHLHTHEATVDHSFRDKYRSAVYYFSEKQRDLSEKNIAQLQAGFTEKIHTKVIRFASFTPSRERIQHYFRKNPNAPFCKKYILPKLEKIAPLLTF